MRPNRFAPLLSFVSTRFCAFLLVGLGCLLQGPLDSSAQRTTTLSDQARASMITIYPGDAIYTEFGHSAIRIADPRTGVNRLYNYGTFNFNEPFFVLKFTYGQLNYMLSTASYQPMISFYQRQNRPMIEQHLNLTAEQVRRLYTFLEVNARPENRVYRYDFLFDNCSTRVRDALESALGPAVQFTGTPSPQKSFRRLLDPYVADRPLIDVGFDVGLGTPSDAVATARQVMFLPEYLLEAFETARVATPRGPEPLVARTDTVFWMDDYNPRERAFPWPLVLMWLLTAIGTAWTVWQIRLAARGPMRAPDTASRGRLDALLYAVAGLAGLVIFFLWFISEHEVTNQNWNLIWAWPTHLLFAAALARGLRSPWMRRYAQATGVITAVLAIGWFVWPQDLHAAIFPLALLLVVRSAWLGYSIR